MLMIVELILKTYFRSSLSNWSSYDNPDLLNIAIFDAYKTKTYSQKYALENETFQFDLST